MAVGAAVYGTALFSNAVHELSHAVAGRAVGERVEAITLDLALRGRSTTLLYAPFVETHDFQDAYWVAGAGVLGSVALGAVGILLARARAGRRRLMGMLLLGATWGAIGIGMLRYGLTGQPGEARDLALLADVVRWEANTYRTVCGTAGLAAVLTTAMLARPVVRQLPMSVRIVALGVASALVPWFFSADGLSIAVVVVTLLLVALPARSRNVGAPQLSEWDVVHVAAIAGGAALSLALLVSLGVGQDSRREADSWVAEDERGTRLRAYWFLRSGHADEAFALLRAAAPKYHSPGFMYDLGVSFRMRGHLEDAERLLSAACRSRPDVQACWGQLAATLEQKRLFGRAAEAWRVAARLERGNPDTRARDRHVHLMQGRARALAGMAEDR